MLEDHARRQVEGGTTVREPFPHVVVDDLLHDSDLAVLKAAFPPAEAFDLKGRGVKLELDVVETARAFAALPPSCQSAWLGVRHLMRSMAGPSLVKRFSNELREHYTWLLGAALAEEILARGFTTTNGRLMGRGLSYRLEPHLDSAHFGVTCLLYFTTANTAADGALCLYKPERTPAVLNASTYYPDKDEGITASIHTEVPIRENRLVAFVNGPTSLHGFSRPTAAPDAADWRFVYQCHVLPDGFDITSLAPRLGSKERTRWESILNRSQM